MHDLFLSYPNVGIKIRFGIPFYDYKTWICYLNPLKKEAGAELVFLKGKILQETFPFLKSKGRKMVAGIKLTTINDADLEQIITVFEEAISLEMET
nr:DUF1801 domain-containing protein [Portibacter lacus]